MASASHRPPPAALPDRRFHIFTLSRTGATVEVQTVDGTALFNDDYTQSGADSFDVSSATATLAAGSAIAAIPVDPTTDAIVETDETVRLSVAAGSGYDLGTPASATATIANDALEAASGSKIYLPIIQADD